MFRLAPVIAVNAASGFTKAIIVFSQHPRKLPRWIAWQERRFGVDFTVHSAGKAHMASNLGNETPMPWVDHWWDGVATGGTSAWGARRLARLLGFDTVILAGVPLETGPYYNGDLPSKTNQSFEAMEHYRQAILKDTDMHDGVFSLSGWTREVFGEPNVADPVA